MSKLRMVSIMALALGSGCSCGDAAVPNDEPEFNSVPPPEDGALPPLFDPIADRALAELVEAWSAVPSDEAAAQAQARTLKASRAALVAAGASGADRIAEVCEGVPVVEQARTLICLRLLSLTESPRGRALLLSRARTPLPSTPALEHPHTLAPELIARRAAVLALERRTREGSTPALEALLTLVREPEASIRAQAVEAVFAALPRWRAKLALRGALSASDRWRLYQAR